MAGRQLQMKVLLRPEASSSRQSPSSLAPGMTSRQEKVVNGDSGRMRMHEALEASLTVMIRAGQGICAKVRLSWPNLWRTSPERTIFLRPALSCIKAGHLRKLGNEYCSGEGGQATGRWGGTGGTRCLGCCRVFEWGNCCESQTQPTPQAQIRICCGN